VTNSDLLEKLHDPFKPFRVRMVDRTVYDIRGPWMIMVGESSAIVATEVGKTSRGYDIALHWKTVSIQHMLKLTDLPRSSKATKRKE
jgi:hypothetical protein